MAHKKPYEKANELLKLAEQDKDPEIRGLRLRAARRYYDADISRLMNRPATVDILVLLLFYIIIFASAFLSFTHLGFFSGGGVVIGTFALLSLMMGVILRVRGDISESGLLAMFRGGARALLLLRRESRSGSSS